MTKERVKEISLSISRNIWRVVGKVWVLASPCS